jgi:hypothetical protein
LKQARRVLQFAGTSGHLVLQRPQLHLLALPDELQQFLLATVDRFHQGVALSGHLALEVGAVLLKARNTSLRTRTDFNTKLHQSVLEAQVNLEDTNPFIIQEQNYGLSDVRKTPHIKCAFTSNSTACTN